MGSWQHLERSTFQAGWHTSVYKNKLCTLCYYSVIVTQRSFTLTAALLRDTQVTVTKGTPKRDRDNQKRDHDALYEPWLSLPWDHPSVLTRNRWQDPVLASSWLWLARLQLAARLSPPSGPGKAATSVQRETQTTGILGKQWITLNRSFIHLLFLQGSKLTLANSHFASDYDNLQARKIPTNRRLEVRIIQFSHTFGKNLQVV